MWYRSSSPAAAIETRIPLLGAYEENVSHDRTAPASDSRNRSDTTRRQGSARASWAAPAELIKARREHDDGRLTETPLRSAGDRGVNAALAF